ncbi:MAG: isochorismate synthase [Flavobacteriaceae bacterium]|nr:isochorismate synthase [Flavobacteriaceae bacterium]
MLKKLHELLESKSPFVAFRKPNGSTITVIEQQDDLLYDAHNFEAKGFVFAPFDTSTKEVLFPAHLIKKTTFSLQNSTGNYTPSMRGEDTASKEKYLLLLEKSLAFIKETEVEKIVISRREYCPESTENEVVLLQRLLSAYSNAFVYLWVHPKVGTWLGASPERLLELQGDVLQTMALAGTQPYLNTEQVVWKQKEITEQQFVTNFVIENLRPFVTCLETSDTYTVKAGRLLHLRTDIEGRLKQAITVRELINHLHPTPAVCGVPKQEAKSFILKNEGYDRRFYTGFLGELNMDDKTCLYVNLRCMEVSKEGTFVYIGGGITIDSIPEKEWEETVSKSKTMKRIL